MEELEKSQLTETMIHLGRGSRRWALKKDLHTWNIKQRVAEHPIPRGRQKAHAWISSTPNQLSTWKPPFFSKCQMSEKHEATVKEIHPPPTEKRTAEKKHRDMLSHVTGRINNHARKQSQGKSGKENVLQPSAKKVKTPPKSHQSKSVFPRVKRIYFYIYIS